MVLSGSAINCFDWCTDQIIDWRIFGLAQRLNPRMFSTLLPDGLATFAESFEASTVRWSRPCRPCAELPSGQPNVLSEAT
jgi:hypothetical protein